MASEPEASTRKGYIPRTAVREVGGLFYLSNGCLAASVAEATHTLRGLRPFSVVRQLTPKEFKMGKFKDNAMATIVWDDVNITLGALVATTAVIVSSKIDSTRLNGFRLLRTEYFMHMRGATTGNSPVLVGMAHELNSTEVLETIVADPQHKGDPQTENRALQPVWPWEVLMANADGDGRVWAQGVAKIGWSAMEGTTFRFFAFNFGPADLTTGAIIHIVAKHFGVWLRD